MSNKKEKNQQIQVFVRVRPFDPAKEPRSNTCLEVTPPKEINVTCLNSKKKFTFDKAFGPTAGQFEVYQSVVNPLIKEVLDGYNCTVFAYGQTGTGKTHTMIGKQQNLSMGWQNDVDAGIIPRALGQLFDELRLSGSEYTVRISYLELYNEELFDLLSETHDNSKIKLFEDPLKKGSVITQGLEEVIVQSKTEVYKILERGAKKRQTASTLLNTNSSRSHTIFSITIHIKESTVDGEDLLKMGKLNLVDLAGSENIGRSGVIEKRAREAGNINQSLLTLGRVITALTERTPHIPYRESKLTRLLQDSLGGHTKTSIIATVSPSNTNLDETLSTLEYANRAKNITNRPETNQRFTKSVLIKQYTDEIKRLREDLIAARNCNGIYIAPDNYDSMIADMKSYQTQLNEKINDCCMLTEELAKAEKITTDLKMDLTKTTNKLYIIEETLSDTKMKCDEKEYVIQKYAETEKKLTDQAKKILEAAKEASEDSYKLHDNLQRRKTIENKNLSQASIFIDAYNKNLSNINEIVARFINEKDVQTQKFLSYIENQQNLDEMFINQRFEKLKTITDSLKSQGMTKMDEIAKFSSSNFAINQETVDILMNFIADLSEKLENFEKENESMKNSQLHQLEMKRKNLKQLQTFLGDTFNDFGATHLSFLDNCEVKFMEMYDYLKKDNEQLQILLKNYESDKEENLQIQQEFLGLVNKLDMLQSKSSNRFEKFYDEHKLLQIEACEMQKSFLKDIKVSCNNNQKQINETIEKVEEYFNNDKNQSDLLKDSICKTSNKIAENCSELVNNGQVNREIISEKLATLTENINQNIENDNQYVEENLNAFEEFKTHITEIENHHHDTLQIHKNMIKTNCECNKTITIDLEENLKQEYEKSKEHLNKFFTEEIILEYPSTGSTPLRKVFHYPTKLEMTSPQPRIISRFHQLRNNTPSINTSCSSNDSDDPSLSSPSMSETEDFGKSNQCNINKSASMNNLPLKNGNLQGGKENLKLKKSNSEKSCF